MNPASSASPVAGLAEAGSRGHRPRLQQNLFLAILLLSGCSPRTEHPDHDAHAREETESPAKFKEGRGLQLAQETAAALGVKTAEVEERPITHAFEITASVFDAGPPARASSLVPVALADALEKHPPTEAKLLSVRRDLALALTQVEIVLALPGTPAVGKTVSLTLHGPARECTAVPRAAVLRSATGTFVYVVNGAYLLRTPVQTGTSDGDYIEILDGLYTGDEVVTAAVEQLWLTELRLTKGGGHSH